MAETEFSRYSMFDFGLETPSKFVHGAGLSEGASDWSTGLTPSLFKHEKPGAVPAEGEDENPFESLYDSSKTQFGSLSSSSATGGLTPSGAKAGFFLPEKIMSRKRALSSPALLTPSLGLTGFDFGEFGSVATELETKPFLPSSLSTATDSLGNTTTSTTGRQDSRSNSATGSSHGPSSLSPESSAVLTPPDIPVSLAPAEASAALGKQPDITVDVSQPFNTQSEQAVPYSQFFMPQIDPATQAAAPTLFQVDGTLLSQSQPSGSSAKTASKKAGSKPPAKLSGTKKKAGPTKAESVNADGEGSQVDADEAEKRASHLERNRIAACKSRQKKKLKVNALETQAAEVSAQNAAIQARALALQNELFHLRALLDAHQGCDCEHVRGYLAREAAGGGIPTIHALAGQVLQLDYSKSPKLGSQADVYSQLGPAPTMMHPIIPIASNPPLHMGPAIPLARKQGPALLQQQHPQPQQPALGMHTRSKGGHGAAANFEAAVLGRRAPEMNLTKPSLTRSARSNSAPPARTPAWDVHPHAAGSYFPQA